MTSHYNYCRYCRLRPLLCVQVEGAFTQGLGLVSLEQCVYLEGNQRTQRGTTFTTGPGTYKIPSVSDVPAEFNVSLLDRIPNPRAIFSSKVRPHPYSCMLSLYIISQ